VNYPVNHLADINLLNSIGCNYVFIPKSEDIYNDYSGIDMEFDGLDQVLEGEFRPGHFQGVVDVVYRLFDLVKPQHAYFGQKDFQQLAVIKKMVLYKKMDIEIVSCPIVREVSGLAMSSRNERLSGKQRSNSAVIYNTMIETANKMKAGNLISEYADYFLTHIQKLPEMRPDYCVFCNHRTLEEIKFVEKNAVIVMCVAVWCEKVRLIDNIILEF
jgi:pantoate--beta-alanine ligase